MRRAAVSDAGPLTHLGEIESLDLLSAFDALLIPEAVSGDVENDMIPMTFDDDVGS